MEAASIEVDGPTYPVPRGDLTVAVAAGGCPSTGAGRPRDSLSWLPAGVDRAD